MKQKRKFVIRSGREIREACARLLERMAKEGRLMCAGSDALELAAKRIRRIHVVGFLKR